MKKNAQAVSGLGAVSCVDINYFFKFCRDTISGVVNIEFFPELMFFILFWKKLN